MIIEHISKLAMDTANITVSNVEMLSLDPMLFVVMLSEKFAPPNMSANLNN